MMKCESLPLISIIVPVYNVRVYLRKCLDSICGQTYKNLEIVVVDDGSTDGSGEICDEYAQLDNRVKVIHQSNAGQSAARNKALSIAQGDFFGFVDSDDWVDKDMYEFLHNLIVESDADIAICSHYIEQQGKTRVRYSSGEKTVFSRDEAIRALVVDKRVRNYLWDKLFKSKLFNGIRFPEKQIFEDIAVSYRLFYNTHQVVMQDSPRYHYLTHGKSTTHGRLYNPQNEYVLFLTVYQQVKFVYEKRILDQAPTYLHQRGVHFIDHLMMVPSSSFTEDIIKDVLAKMREFYNVSWVQLGTISAFKRYMIYRHLYIYRVFYRSIRLFLKSRRYKFQLL